MATLNIIYYTGTGNTADMAKYIKEQIIGKTVGLFGSYDWGQGGWMETWREEMINEGFSIVNDGLIIHLAVDDDEKIEKCKEYGKAIVG